MTNQEIAKSLLELAYLLDIKGVDFKPKAYRKAARSLESLDKDVREIYKEEGLKGLEKIPGVGKSIAAKIEEFLKTKKIKTLEDLDEETAVRQIVTHFFETKGVDLSELKANAKKQKIVYSRFTKPAKQLLELSGSTAKAKEAVDKVAEWAKSRNLDYAIETVFKKWLELDRLKPKEVVKKPYFQGKPMVWSQTRKRWYVIGDGGEWLEFAGKESEMEWEIEKK
ncbi:MAG: helix-hairpin-helix domain-containing protein [Candidatus Paceibacterota bacterium]|jgi:DNA polymerase/3'-5' exonuclease PolX